MGSPPRRATYPHRPTPRPVRWPTGERARALTLPGDWAARRAAVLERDGHACRWVTRGVRCLARARHVDHIADKHDHRLANLRALCDRHNAERTAAQGVDAARAARTRPLPEHPFRRLTENEP